MNNIQKKILITGANGQLGKKLIDNIYNSEYKKVIELYCNDIEDLDITNEIVLKRFLEENKFEIVINCAAYTNVDLAEDNYEVAKSINADAPRYLAKYTKQTGGKLIHISSDYVFDGGKNTPYKEDDTPNPISVYGKTKLIGEKNVMAENSDAIIIRTSWLYSEHGKNFLKTILRLSEEKEELDVVFDQVGTPTYAGNLAAEILYICLNYINLNNWYSGIYHYSDLGVCSWYDFACAIVEAKRNIKNKNIPIINPVLSENFPSKVKRPNYSVLDKSKIIKTYSSKISYWRDSCSNVVSMIELNQN